MPVLPMGICQGYSAVVGEVQYVCILKKNVCVGSKFEDISLTKWNSDCYRNKWETFRYSCCCTKKLICVHEMNIVL